MEGVEGYGDGWGMKGSAQKGEPYDDYEFV